MWHFSAGIDLYMLIRADLNFYELGELIGMLVA